MIYWPDIELPVVPDEDDSFTFKPRLSTFSDFELLEAEWANKL